MKHVFIDCGANVGQSIETFKRYRTDWEQFEIHSFEANPNLKKHFDKYSTLKNFNFHSTAVWISDGNIKFYIDASSTAFGSSLNVDKDNVSDSRFELIDSIDISNWIFSNFKQDDFIILKLDIEGSEYDVINHMIDTNSISYINILFVEFHDHKLKNKFKKYDSVMIIQKLKDNFPNLILHFDTHRGLNFI
jgi:FkbM family methyltransferase